MIKIFQILLKKIEKEGPTEGLRRALERGATFERIDRNVVQVTFLRRKVIFLIIRKLSESGTHFNLFIKTDIFKERSPYYNNDNEETKLSYDRILFYLQTYIGY